MVALWKLGNEPTVSDCDTSQLGSTVDLLKERNEERGKVTKEQRIDADILRGFGAV